MITITYAGFWFGVMVCGLVGYVTGSVVQSHVDREELELLREQLAKMNEEINDRILKSYQFSPRPTDYQFDYVKQRAADAAELRDSVMKP